MDDQGMFVNISSNDGPVYIPLPSPCVLDCETDAGLISLILDRTFPQFLIVHINGEPRKCVGLSEYNLAFENDGEVKAFLKKVSESELMDEMIQEETRINEGWHSL